MKNYIIFDLEATCKENDNNYLKETIEIGAVKFNSNLQEIDTFETFIKPKTNPILTQYCTKLTTITQENIDCAENFNKVINRFKKWIGNDYILCSWGFFDRSLFKSDCKLWDIDDGWVNRHISLKHQFAKLYNLKKPCGMAKALNMLNIPLTGTHHRGIDDAKNIAKIFKKEYPNWKF